MKVVLLGGNGFIGTHIVDQLRNAGHEIHIFDRSYERARTPLKDVRYHIADFNDKSKLSNAIDGADVVYHLISTTVPSTSNLDPLRDIQENLLNSVSLLQLMVDRSIQRIVFLSSGGTVYGIPEIVPVSESHSLNPICSHGIVKIAIENYLHMFHMLYGLHYVILRASNPYGARQVNYGVQGIVSTIIKNAVYDKPVEIWGDGSIIRDYIYVEDLAGLCVKVLDANAVDIFNAGSGVGYSIKDILHVVEEEMKTPISIEYKQGRTFDVPKIVLDISKVKKKIGWEPSTTLQEGIRKTLSQMKRIIR